LPPNGIDLLSRFTTEVALEPSSEMKGRLYIALSCTAIYI